MFFYQMRLKMDQKRHIIDQKALKMYVKGQKLQFWDIKYLLLAEFSLAKLGGTPSPLNGKLGVKKKGFFPLGKRGGPPPPLTDEFR